MKESTKKKNKNEKQEIKKKGFKFQFVNKEKKQIIERRKKEIKNIL